VVASPPTAAVGVPDKFVQIEVRAKLALKKHCRESVEYVYADPAQTFTPQEGNLRGIELVSIEARVVIASVETYLKYAEAIGLTATAAAPA